MPCLKGSKKIPGSKYRADSVTVADEETHTLTTGTENRSHSLSRLIFLNSIFPSVVHGSLVRNPELGRSPRAPRSSRAQQEANHERGFLLWVELPDGLDATVLARKVLEQGISVAPGMLFSQSNAFDYGLRLNGGRLWSASIRSSLETLGEMTWEMSDGLKHA